MKLRYVALLICLWLTACNNSGPSIDYQAKITQEQFISGNSARGETLFNKPVIGATNAPGCITCHFAEADQNVLGPSQVGLATLAVKNWEAPNYTGQAVSLTGYLWESTVDPNASVTPGFTPVMFAQYGERLTEQEIADVVAYMMTLKE